MIAAERITDRFLKLVEFDSESGNEQNIGNYLENELKRLGLTVEKDATGNIYALLEGNADVAPILFSAHQDTVSPGTSKKAIVHEDGKITSDGTTVLGSDDISGIVSILEALESIKEDKSTHGDIEVIFSVSEETFCEGIKKFDFNRVQSKRAYILDLSGDIGTAAIAAPSILSLNISVIGKSAHSGFAPELGIHSIKIAAEAISKIDNGRIDEETTVNFGIIKGGIAPNIVPGRVDIQGEIRSMNHDKAINHAKAIVKTFEDVASEYGAVIESEIITNIKAYRVSKDSQVVKAYIGACDRLGIETRITETFGGSDNNVFVNNGIEGIVIACAMNDVHTVNEYTSIDQLTDSSRVVLELALTK